MLLPCYAEELITLADGTKQGTNLNIMTSYSLLCAKRVLIILCHFPYLLIYMHVYKYSTRQSVYFVFLIAIEISILNGSI